VDILTLSDLPPWYRTRTLRLLRSLCGSWGVLPTSYAFQGDVKLLDEHPFVPASRFVEVFRGESGGKMVAVKTLTKYLSEDPSRLKRVGIMSRCPLHSTQTNPCLAIVSGGRHLETHAPPKYPSVTWRFSQPSGVTAMSNIPMDVKR